MNAPQPFSPLDIGFAQFLSKRSRLDALQKPRFEDLVLELSSRQSSGHSCITITREDHDLLMASGLASTGLTTPLVIDSNRLYMHRYWHYEQRLATQLKALSSQTFNTNGLDSSLARYFPSEGDETNWQKLAASHAAHQALTIITGGPGTGKTTTVLKILALLLEAAEQPLHIALTAPTGKAAMRLQESITVNKATLDCSATLKTRIPEKASTLHRLLGPQPPSPYFKHNADNPLPYDVVVIDETSMVDLALMSKLVDALKSGSRLILLGDKDQLASVESGAVLADLTIGLPRQTIELQKSHRFQGHIKLLADAVNQQQADTAWQLLEDASQPTYRIEDAPIDLIVNNYLSYLQRISDGDNFANILAAFNQFRVLCANQIGHHSVKAINHLVEQALLQHNKIKPGNPWYVGRPVMITRNHTSLHLYNGDIGICLEDSESNGQLRVFFASSDGRILKLRPTRLPAHQTVYAMTIHKSQGSEFDKVLIMLPEKINPILSKELLYTAITRAKNSVAIVTDRAVFYGTVGHKVARNSGLAAKLNINLQEPSEHAIHQKTGQAPAE